MNAWFRAATVAALGLFAASGAHAQQWNLASAYNEGNFHTKNLHAFAEDVKARTGGKLQITIHSGMSLYRLPEIKRAVSSGQIPIGEFLLQAYGNEDPILEADGIPFLVQGYERAWALWQAQKPILAERFEKQGMMLLYSVAWPGSAIYTIKPIASDKDFAGLKMRAYSATSARMIQLLGGVPTTVEQVEVPQAFATGLVAAMITSPTTGADTQAWDFTKQYYDTQMAHPKNAVVVNRRAFARLDKTAQDAILAAGAAAEERGWKSSGAIGEAAKNKLQANGMTINAPSPELQALFKRIGAQMTEEWVKRAGPDGEKIAAALRK